MRSPSRRALLLVVALVGAYGVNSALHVAPVAAACKAWRCKATAVPTSTPTATPSPTPTPSPTATATATPTATATLLSTSMSPWYLADSTGNVSTVNATMMWDGDTNQSSPLPTGTLTATVYDASCPVAGCIYTHTITSSDYQWAPNAGGWSLHYAFSLGTEYPPTDTFWVSYSGDSTFAASSAQAMNT